MGIWKEIKYALNSRLGTETFEPLDELIIQQTRLVASDELYAELQDMEVRSSENDKFYPNQLIMKKYGTIMLKWGIYKPSSGEGGIKIYKNNNEVFVQSYPNFISTTQFYSTTIIVEPGDVLTLSAYMKGTSGSPMSITDMGIYASFKETAFMETPRMEE